MDFTLSQVKALTHFIEPFESTGFRFSTYSPPVQDKDGYWCSGHNAVSLTGDAFVQALIDNGWGTVNFDWPTFVNGPEYRGLVKAPDGFDDATSEQIAKVITSILRRDRFADGWLTSAFEDGTVLRMLKRLKVIETEMEVRS